MKNLIFIFILFFSFFSLSRAQLVDTSGDNILITLQPKYPGPNQEVEVTLTSVGLDINRSHITWYKNNSLVLQGTGAKNYRFTTGNVGETEILSVRVRSNNTDYQTKKEFIIGDIDILWSANTTIPPEYTGRALPSSRSQVTVTAFPQFFIGKTSVSSDTLIYEWFIQDKKIPEASGAGKKIMEFTTSPNANAPYKITLLLSSPLKSIVSEKSIFIPIVAPEVLLYEEKSLEGPFLSRNASAVAMRSGEKKNFRAIPYFFSKNGSGGLEYSWFVNGKKIDADPKSFILEFGLEPDKTGVVTIETEVKNIKNTLQKALTKLIINVR